MFKRWLVPETTKSCLLIGPRRAGKTTHLRQLFPAHHYSTLDDLDNLAWAQHDPKGFISSLGQQAIIDEIQRCPLLTVAIKYAIDNENAHFVLTGSSTIGLLDSTSDTLAGRINIYALPTACWGEDLAAADHAIFQDQVPLPKIKKAQRILKDALTYGQFPEVLTQTTNEEKSDLLRNYKNTYFTRDLMQLANLDNLDGLMAIFGNLAKSLGSHLEVSNFAREAGVSFPTAKKYLNTLAQSQLTFKLYGYQYGPAKRYVKAAKTYFADMGILQSLNIHLNEGQLLENFVIAELEKRRKLDLIKTDQFYYFKSAGGQEIDLVFEWQQLLYAIEIKSTAQPTKRDIRNLRTFATQVGRHVRPYLFYTGETYQEIDGVQIIPVSALFCGK